MAMSILDSFGALCPTQGEWSKTALGYANSLVGVYRDLSTSAECQSVAQGISQLENISRSLKTIETDPLGRDIAGLKRKEQELLLQLASASTALDQELVLKELRGLQAEIAEFEGFESFDRSQSRLRRQGESYEQVITSTQILLKQLAANSVCLDKRPQLLTGLASLAGSVAAVATTGGLSLGLAAGTDLLGTLIEGIRQKRIAREINEIASPMALRAHLCVIESLNNHWCAADDGRKVIDVRIKSMEDPQSRHHPLLQGFQLFDKQLPIFLGWLESVRNGIEPSDLGGAQRQMVALNREKLVREAKILAIAQIAETKSLFDSASGVSPETKRREQWRIYRSTVVNINRLLFQSSGSSLTNHPLRDIFPSPLDEYNLIGIESTEDIPKAANNALIPFEQLELERLPANFVLSFEFLKTRMLAWVELARQRVTVELRQVLNADPLFILTSAANANPNPSPYTALLDLATYIKENKPKNFSVGSAERLYEDTYRRLKTIAEQIELVVNTPPELCAARLACASPIEAISEIYRISELQNGTLVLGSRIENALRTGIHEALETDHTGLPTPTANLLLASDDVISELQKYASTKSLTSIEMDLLGAQQLVTKILDSYGSLFGVSLSESFAQEFKLEKKSRWPWKKKSKEPKPDLQPDQQRSLASMCLILSTLPQWPAELNQDICLQTQVKSIFAKGPHAPQLTAEYLARKPQERACGLRDYLRAADIYQDSIEPHRPGGSLFRTGNPWTEMSPAASSRARIQFWKNL
jgi:hypothetical protein